VTWASDAEVLSTFVFLRLSQRLSYIVQFVVIVTAFVDFVNFSRHFCRTFFLCWRW